MPSSRSEDPKAHEWKPGRQPTADDAPPLHFEPYVHLAGLTYHSVLLSWGGFYFRPGAHGGTAPGTEAERGEWMVMDDESFDDIQPDRRDSIGERSSPYGRAEVEIRDARGRTVARDVVEDRNHVWLDGLQPDTEYTYDIRVDGRSWSDAEHFDWEPDGNGALGLRRSGRRYANRFRTHPSPDQATPLRFAVLGDFGIGIRTRKPDAERQRRIARGLERVVDEMGVRLVLTVGDNIYLGEEGSEATGDEDDDWFFTFYQPYRYVLDRVPFYPTVGNHDAEDTEKSDDREQLDDNYFLRQRFMEEREAGRSASDPGLFYVFQWGADVEFVCIDTTRGGSAEAEGEAEGRRPRYFEYPRERRFLEEAFPDAAPSGRSDGEPGARDSGGTDVGEASGPHPWRIPFSHHPVYCAGPKHGNTDGMEEVLVPLFRRSGTRLVLAGHEHNFQYSVRDGIHYVVSGSGGKLRPDRPDVDGFERAGTRAWAAAGHFLVVEIEGDRAVVRPLTVDDDGSLRDLAAETPDGEPFTGPIVVPRRRSRP